MSFVVKRSISIRGHRTSFSLEQPFFEDLMAIAGKRGIALAALVSEIDASRPKGANLSSAIRLHVLDWAKTGSFAERSDHSAAAGRDPERS